MLKKNSSLALTGLIIHLMICLSLPAHAQSNNDPQLSERVKSEVAAIGVGARVSVKLLDKKNLTGYVTQVDENDFVITKAKEGTRQTIAYSEVAEVKRKNEKRISTAGKILIVWGVLGIIALIGTGGGG